MSNKKFVYLFETGQLSNIDNCYHFYDSEIYSSQKKIELELANRVLVNGGYSIEREAFNFPTFNGGKYTLFTYKCMDTEGVVEMSIRYRITKKEVK